MNTTIRYTINFIAFCYIVASLIDSDLFNCYTWICVGFLGNSIMHFFDNEK